MSGMLPDLISAVPTRSLSKEEIQQAASALLDTSVADNLKADFLQAWAQRGEKAAELAAFVRVFLPQAVDPGVRGSWNGRALLDCSGTGGGGLNLINISTGLMFIASAMGIPVVKHGNRGITKKSGSADVLEALGIKIDLAPDQVKRCLEEVGCAFLFAPSYHPTFAAIAPVRRKLAEEGQRTVFNLLGPLLNPARPDARMVGVFKQEHLSLYFFALLELGCPAYAVVYGEDIATKKSIGEVTAQGTTTISTNIPSLHKRPANFFGDNKLFSLEINPAEEPANMESMIVKDAAESAQRITAILSNEEQGLGRDTLLINAAVAAWTQGAVKSVEDGMTQATEALDSGKALAQLKKWQKFSK